MKAAFTTSGSDLNAPLDDRFGRAPKFLMVDLETESFEIVDNKQNLNAAQAWPKFEISKLRFQIGGTNFASCG